MEHKWEIILMHSEEFKRAPLILWCACQCSLLNICGLADVAIPFSTRTSQAPAWRHYNTSSSCRCKNKNKTKHCRSVAKQTSARKWKEILMMFSHIVPVILHHIYTEIIHIWCKLCDSVFSQIKDSGAQAAVFTCRPIKKSNFRSLTSSKSTHTTIGVDAKFSCCRPKAILKQLVEVNTPINEKYNVHGTRQLSNTTACQQLHVCFLFRPA